QDKILESQNSVLKSSLSIHLINTVDNNNLFLDIQSDVDNIQSDADNIQSDTDNIQSDADNIYMQKNKFGSKHSLELVQSFLFSNWQLFKIWIKQFVKQEGFSYKIRTSEADNGIIRRAVYVCSKADTYNLQVTSDNRLNILEN
ncbi:30031_t:CDS:1, partial [Racocetra persica]